MLAETPVTQCSPCYSAVSASLTNPLSDCSNYSPFCHILRIYTLAGQTLYQTNPLETVQRYTAESSQELMSSEEYRSALRKLNKQKQVVMFLLLSSNCHLNSLLSLSLFSLSLSSLSSHSQSSLFSPLASPPSLLSLLINSLST